MLKQIYKFDIPPKHVSPFDSEYVAVTIITVMAGTPIKAKRQSNAIVLSWKQIQGLDHGRSFRTRDRQKWKERAARPTQEQKERICHFIPTLTLEHSGEQQCTMYPAGADRLGLLSTIRGNCIPSHLLHLFSSMPSGFLPPFKSITDQDRSTL